MAAFHRVRRPVAALLAILEVGLEAQVHHLGVRVVDLEVRVAGLAMTTMIIQQQLDVLHPAVMGEVCLEVYGQNGLDMEVIVGQVIETVAEHRLLTETVETAHSLGHLDLEVLPVLVVNQDLDEMEGQVLRILTDKMVIQVWMETLINVQALWIQLAKVNFFDLISFASFYY